MGRLLVTNDSMWRKRLDAIFQNSGFGLNCEFREVSTYKKLNLYVQNYAKIEGGYIAACGTYIYQNKGGSDALRAIYADIKLYGIERVRRNIIGGFAICIKQNEIIRIFVDETNTYRFYYHVNEDKYLCTNSAYHIAKIINASINEDNFLIFVHSRVLSGGRSIYNDVMQLSADKVLVIDHGNIRIENLKITKKKYNFESREEALQILKKKIDDTLKARRAVFKNELLFLTGGVDSRLEFAMHLSNKENVKTAYWSGKDMITNGREEDKNICKKMSEDNGVKFTFFDVAEDIEESISSIDYIWADKYGDYSSIYAGNTKFFSIFEDMGKNVDLINFGALGEALRNMSDFDVQYTKGYTNEKLAADMFMKFHLQDEVLIKEKERVIHLIGEEIREDFKYGNKSTLSVEEAVHIFTYRRLYANTIIVNFANLFSNSFQILTAPEVFDIITSIPYEWKMGSAISLALTETYRSELLGYPYFTNHHFEKYSHSAKKLMPSVGHIMKERLQYRFSDLWLYKKISVKIVRPMIYPYTRANDEICRYCEKVLKNSPFIKKSSIRLAFNEEGCQDISAYAQFVAMVKLIDTLEA